MEIENILLGHAADCEVNGVDFVIRSYDLEIRKTKVNVNNSSTGGFVAEKVDKKQLVGTLTAQRSSDVDYHTDPLNIVLDDYVTLKIYPQGKVNDANNFYYAEKFLIDSFKSTGQAESGAQEITLGGASTGEFTYQ
jgi:hypothetical protein